MKRIAWLCLCLSVGGLAQSVSGIRPRGSSADYPVQQTVGGLTVAAAIIPPDQVHKIFAADLNRAGYIVLEVAVYPEAGRSVNLSAGDFLLRIDSTTVRATGGAAIATILTKDSNTPSQPNDVTVVTTANVGYESGGYDPVTGHRRSSVYTGAGVGVERGNPGGPPANPGAPGHDPVAIQYELDSKAPPEGNANVAVAGYLYFPKVRGKNKHSALELDYYGAASQIKLRLPVPAKP
jgi:hypothetical protein